MGVTIKDVAKEAGVSIATVSHVINRTRYVRPELAEQVERAMEATGYSKKVTAKESNMKIGRESIIAVVIPNVGGTMYSQLVTALTGYLAKGGYIVSVYLSFDDLNREKLILEELANDKRIGGIILAPVSNTSKSYKKILTRQVPFLCLERTVIEHTIPGVLSDSATAVYKGMQHLINSGHEKIAVLLEDRELTTMDERLTGYRNAILDAGLRLDSRLVLKLDLYKEELCPKRIAEHYRQLHPTAYLAGGNRLTLLLLRTLQKLALECPKDVSVIGFGDTEWCQLTAAPLTTLKQNTEEMARQAARMLVEQIESGERRLEEIKVPVRLEIRKSTQMIGKGPFGERAVAPEELVLSEEEIRRLQAGNFKVGVSFHYSGPAWEILHERGIRDTLAKCGITLLSVMDAHFDPALQVIQLEGLKMQGVDAVIAIPVDDEATAQKFEELAQVTRLVFLSNVPVGMEREEYASLVSVNERENGHNAGILLGEYFKDRENVPVGLIGHGSPFSGTHLRDMETEQTIRDEYPNLDIVSVEYFYQIEKAYGAAKKMLEEHPEIQGLYVSWDRPALEVIRALKELGRTDVAVVTTDLDLEIAKYLAREEMVVGLSTQRPYEQGVAAALAVAKALLGERGFDYIGVPPCLVQPKNLLQAWKDILHESAPEEMVSDLTNKFT